MIVKAARSARGKQIIEHVTQSDHHITQERLTSVIGRPGLYSIVIEEMVYYMYSTQESRKKFYHMILY